MRFADLAGRSTASEWKVVSGATRSDLSSDRTSPARFRSVPYSMLAAHSTLRVSGLSVAATLEFVWPDPARWIESERLRLDSKSAVPVEPRFESPARPA